MSEHTQPHNPIDTAWAAANDANMAFDPYREARDRLTVVRQVAELALPGVTIEEHVLPDLQAEHDQRKKVFDAHLVIAAPLMQMLKGPFEMSPNAREEIDFNSPLVDEKELRRFGQARNYQSGRVTQVINQLNALAAPYEVDDIHNYQSPNDPTQAEYSEIRRIYYQKDGVPFRGIDKATLRNHIAHYVQENSSEYTTTFANFLIDYCNRAFPDKEPLPPILNKSAKLQQWISQLKEMAPRNLLLDAVELSNGQQMELVTDLSLTRHAVLSGIHRSAAKNQATKLIAAIRTEFTAPLEQESQQPHIISDGFAFMGNDFGGFKFGFLPRTFTKIIEKYEKDLADGGKPFGYTAQRRAIALHYLHDLKALPTTEN